MLHKTLVVTIYVEIAIYQYCCIQKESLDLTCSLYFVFHLLARAKELANTVGGAAVSLAELDSFHPEDGMILANTTSIGMQPKVDETPISKVRISCRHSSMLE